LLLVVSVVVAPFMTTSKEGMAMLTGAMLGGKERAQHGTQELADLVERIEKAMRPVSERGHGPDHDRVRELYRYLQTVCTGDALERARRAVLYEILSPTVQVETSNGDPSARGRFLAGRIAVFN
jgi:hypothetical protein